MTHPLRPSRYRRLWRTTIVVAWLALHGQAASAIPTGFRGLGSSTVDVRSGLEWLDLTETLARPYVDVFQDIRDTGTEIQDDFAASDGWRYATLADFYTLVDHWFDLGGAYAGGDYTDPPFGASDEPLVEEFIQTFGETLDPFLDGANSALDVSASGAGQSRGVLVAVSVDFVTANVYHGLVFDNELVFRSTGTGGSDADDRLDTFLQSNGAQSTLGSFLVRQASVPEPSSLWLLVAGALGLAARRPKH